MLLINNTVRKVPIARITVDTPHMSGEVDVQYLPDAIYDLIIGNVPGARSPDDSGPRTQAKNEGKHTLLKVANDPKSTIVNKNELVRLQREDKSLEKFWDRRDIKLKGEREVSFEENDRVLYRSCKHPHVNVGKPSKQVMIATPF